MLAYGFFECLLFLFSSTSMKSKSATAFQQAVGILAEPRVQWNAAGLSSRAAPGASESGAKLPMRNPTQKSGNRDRGRERGARSRGREGGEQARGLRAPRRPRVACVYERQGQRQRQRQRRRRRQRRRKTQRQRRVRDKIEAETEAEAEIKTGFFEVRACVPRMPRRA